MHASMQSTVADLAALLNAMNWKEWWRTVLGQYRFMDMQLVTIGQAGIIAQHVQLPMGVPQPHLQSALSTNSCCN